MQPSEELLTGASPAPYDWHPADKYLPQPNEFVRVYQLMWWAVHDGTTWYAADSCGNRGFLAWRPNFWRREYQPQDPQ